MYIVRVLQMRTYTTVTSILLLFLFCSTKPSKQNHCKYFTLKYRTYWIIFDQAYLKNVGHE